MRHGTGQQQRLPHAVRGIGLPLVSPSHRTSARKKDDFPMALSRTSRERTGDRGQGWESSKFKVPSSKSARKRGTKTLNVELGTWNAPSLALARHLHNCIAGAPGLPFGQGPGARGQGQEDRRTSELVDAPPYLSTNSLGYRSTDGDL